MDSPAATTFVFAPEIEQALVAACFQVPERITKVLRDLDVVSAITVPDYRYILEAINLCYRELGNTDFPFIIQCLRELGHLEACGGLDGVNNTLDQYRFGFSSPQAAEQIIDHYIEMLRAYALARADALIGQQATVFCFADGKATLYPNKLKRRENDPDYLGPAHVCGKRYVAKAWVAIDGSFLNLRLQPLP